MELINKLKYEAPTSEALEIQMESVLCGSDPKSSAVYILSLEALNDLGRADYGIDSYNPF